MVGGTAVVLGAAVVVTGTTVVVVGAGTVVVGATEGAEAGEVTPPTVVMAPSGAEVEERCVTKLRAPVRSAATMTANAILPPIALFLATLRPIISTATVRHPAKPF